MTTIHLGFEVGTGKPVEIPIRHMVICGQTQEAGKTTTLEALITRSNLPAVAFVTKRGEQSFTGGLRIQPYFRERADWQFVASVLEATMKERLKFERSWIMRASKGARTLADVQRNVRTLMATAKGLSGDVYYTLNEYLEIVVPRVAAVHFATTMNPAKGLNVIDLSDRDRFPSELQALVMRSVLEWVYEKADGTITIIPEAWEFCPQRRGSPVKLAAIELIRKGAGLRNYVWLDSQDIGGVEKEILRSCPVWLLGVQREANEIARTLDNIPAGVAKPKPADLAKLGKGQFYACWSSHVIRTYVQPAWMGSAEAQCVAVGDMPVNAYKRSTPPKPKEDNVTTQRAEELTAENTRLRNEIAEFKARIQMTRGINPPPTANDHGFAAAAANAEAIAREAIEIVLKSPPIIALQRAKPELEVTVTRKTITLDEFSLKGRIARLLSEGFFREPKGPSAIRTALKRTGPDCNTANIGRAMDDYTKDGFVTDEGSGYREVPEMKVNIVKQ